MRKLNVKLFLALVIGTAALAGGVWALHGFQYQRIAAALLWQARRAEDAGKIDQMRHYLERYLDFAPQDLEEQAHLGRTLAGADYDGNLLARRQAFFVLNKVLAKDADRPDLQRLLVKTSLEVNELNAARRNLEALAKRAPDADAKGRAELEGYWGRLLEAEKKPADAIPYCRQAIQDDPSDVGSYIRLAWLLRAAGGTQGERQKNMEEADRTINDLVDKNASSPKAHLARWRYRREFDLLDVRGRNDPSKMPVDKAAAEDIDAALAQTPEDVDALIAKADAEVLLERGDRTHRDRAYVYLQQGLKLQSTPGYHGASDMAEFDLLWHLATLLLSDPKLAGDENKMAEVGDTIARLRRTRGQPAAADYLEARLLIQKKEWAKAAALLERTRPALAARQVHTDLLGQIDLCLGQCFEALEEWPQAAVAFKRAVDWDPNRAEARAGLGAAERMLGRYDDAADNLAKAAADSPQPGKAWLDVARLEILRQLQQDKRDWAKAEAAIDQAAHAFPRDAKEAVQPALLRAEILAIQNDLSGAEKLLTDARNAHPDRVEFWTALADLAGRRRDEKGALAILDEAEKALGDPAKAELRVCRAFHLAADPTKENLAALDDLARMDHSGLGADDLDRLLSGLAEAEIRAGRVAQATGLLEELGRTPARRTDLRLRLTLFDLALRRCDDAKGADEATRKERVAAVDQALADIRDVEGGRGAYYELGQAVRLTHFARQEPKDAKASLDEAWAALDRAADLQPDWSAVELARADVAELGGDVEGVITHLKEAVRLEQVQASPAVIQRLVEALNQRGRYAESKEYLAKLQQSLLIHSPIGRIAVGVALNTGDPARAAELFDSAVGPDPTDYHDLLLRARCREATKRDKEAEDDYRKATELAPQEPAVWVAYVLYLGEHGHDAEAAALVQQDVAVKVAKEKAALTVAQCYEVLGNATEAKKAYDAALAARPDDPAVVRAVAGYRLRTGRPLEAKPLLEQMVRGQVGSTDADGNWARYCLALILAGSTNYHDFREAAELVGLRLDANGVLLPESDAARGESFEARRAKARVLATQPQRQFRVRAIQLLEALQSSDLDDQFILSMLYEADGAEDKQVEILKHLSSLDDRAVVPAYLSQYTQVLLRQGRSDKSKLDAAEALVVRLGKLEEARGLGAGSFGSVDLRARLLEARGEGDAAVESLRAFAHRPGAKPEDGLLVVASLARQKRCPEAFAYLDKEDLWTKCAPEVVGSAAEALLRSMDRADEQRDRVEDWLRSAIAKGPKKTVLRIQLADLCDLRGRYAEAIAVDREILNDEPGNVVVLNNLASLLSQQTGQAAEALKYIDQAINGIGRRAELLDTHGQVELALGDAQAALADFTEAVNDAATATRLFHLAQAQYKAGDRDGATRTLQRARTEFNLQPSSVHAMEQQVCQTLLTELKVK